MGLANKSVVLYESIKIGRKWYFVILSVLRQPFAECRVQCFSGARVHGMLNWIPNGTQHGGDSTACGGKRQAISMPVAIIAVTDHAMAQ